MTGGYSERATAAAWPLVSYLIFITTGDSEEGTWTGRTFEGMHASEEERAQDLPLIGLSLSSLSLGDDDGNDTGPKLSDRVDPLEALGLNLRQNVFPTADGVEIVYMNTYMIFRPNTMAPGVVFTDYATALFISASEKQYNDTYGKFWNALLQGGAQEVDLLYDLPAGKSLYADKAKRHFRSLEAVASAVANGKRDFTYEHEQPYSSVYVFFKIPVSGSGVVKHQGPYVSFGRFQVQPRLAGSEQLMTQLRLRLFTVDQAARVQELRLRRGMTPQQDEVNPGDIDGVSKLLSM